MISSRGWMLTTTRHPRQVYVQLCKDWFSPEVTLLSIQSRSRGALDVATNWGDWLVRANSGIPAPAPTLFQLQTP